MAIVLSAVSIFICEVMEMICIPVIIGGDIWKLTKGEKSNGVFC
ncbi:hypothetical protein IMAU80188_02772 [Lactiplantibacillus plantarum]|nr:hypothetical protein [Lactiplantibacillus plantarum]MCG0619168.1 hypothetical protein [Lactiplantibacillus plantarum]MCG0779656.1 hypothetical protein [Lactiplantibacillus plantarum]MCG0807599.1 hypothetical protein [Lactiplantibacillus plantarum]MCG0832474.1 hypothetical protein [Lactiplantibacillus plantarum]